MCVCVCVCVCNVKVLLQHVYNTYTWIMILIFILICCGVTHVLLMMVRQCWDSHRMRYVSALGRCGLCHSNIVSSGGGVQQCYDAQLYLLNPQGSGTRNELPLPLRCYCYYCCEFLLLLLLLLPATIATTVPATAATLLLRSVPAAAAAAIAGLIPTARCNCFGCSLRSVGCVAWQPSDLSSLHGDLRSCSSCAGSLVAKLCRGRSFGRHYCCYY
jgi:hypothetical protein